MLLVADIGNTNITFGVYENETMPEILRLPSDKELPQEEYEILLHTLFKNYDIDSCIIGSVVHELDEKLKNAISETFKITPVLLDNNMDIGIKLDLKTPHEVGADRVANAYAAYMMYEKPVIVVDLGTATTFDIINRNGDFIGGVIMPGINLQFNSLCRNTSKLPKINADKSEKAIGDSTENAILSGVIRGTACAIEGLINQCEKELGKKAIIVATGGDSELIAEYMTRQFDFVNPYLTLEGLRFLYKRLSAGN